MRPGEYIYHFCAAPEMEERDFLHKPARFAGSLYACDGAIFICTEDDPSVEASNSHSLINAAIKMEAAMEHVGPFVPMPILSSVPWFDGDRVIPYPVSIGHSRFHYYYLNLIKQLPGIEIAPHPTDPEGMAFFHFVGGWGSLAPCVSLLPKQRQEESCAA